MWNRTLACRRLLDPPRVSDLGCVHATTDQFGMRIWWHLSGRSILSLQFHCLHTKAHLRLEFHVFGVTLLQSVQTRSTKREHARHEVSTVPRPWARCHRRCPATMRSSSSPPPRGMWRNGQMPGDYAVSGTPSPGNSRGTRPQDAQGLPLTWKCTDPCRKTTFPLKRAFLHFRGSWWEGIHFLGCHVKPGNIGICF